MTAMREVLVSPASSFPSVSPSSCLTLPLSLSLSPPPLLSAAQIAIRHVPDQDPSRLVSCFRAHVAHEFAKLRSRGNSVDVRVDHVGDW